MTNQRINRLRVVGQWDELVRFDNDGLGGRSGSGTCNCNALVASERAVAVEADAHIKKMNAVAVRPSIGFGAWLTEFWRYLFNWKPAPFPAARKPEPIQTEMYFLDRDGYVLA